jgi:multiple sugar transport system ATP-binding protein
MMGAIDLEHVTKRFDDGTVAVDDVTLSVAEGEFMILVGPSGCGKTTALRMIAGLEETTEGTIRIGGREVAHLPPSRRDVAMVFQNYALYPHMTVRENIGFPLRKQKLSKQDKKARVQEVARLLAIEELLDRKPRALSGGQRQRVAMGRAIIRRPQAFLMDEPLSNLDAKLRVQMRVELLELHRRLRVTTVYVTHDQTEAMTLGDRVAVLNRGIVQQLATPQHLYRHPANVFVASFIGSPAMNLLRGRLEEGAVRLGPYTVPLGGALLSRLTRRAEDVVVGLRPEDLVIAASAGDSFPATVAVTEQLGPETLAFVRIPDLDVVEEGADRPAGLAATIGVRLEGTSDVRPERTIELAARADRVQLFDSETGESLLRPPADTRLAG